MDLSEAIKSMNLGLLCKKGENNSICLAMYDLRQGISLSNVHDN